MAKIEKDSFEHNMRHQLTFVKSTMFKVSMKEKRQLNQSTREIMFGFNNKKDNISKTGQLKLF